MKALRWLPTEDGLRFHNDLCGRRQINIDEVMKSWMNRCVAYVHDLSAGDMRDDDAEHRKLITYRQLFASPACDFNKPASYLRTDIRGNKVAALARFRLSAHHLLVEVGRWQGSRYSARLCDAPNCNHRHEVQDEEHVVFRCGMTAELRSHFPHLFQADSVQSMQSFWQQDIKAVASYITCCMSIFDRQYAERFRPDDAT